MYTLLIALIYLAFVSLGLPDSLLGAGWPVMHQSLDVPLSFMGIVSAVIAIGTIVSSLISDTLTRRFGTRTVTIFSVFLSAAALFGFSVSTKFWMLILFAIPYGLAGGAIDAALNNYAALHYKPKHMSWLHCFWGVGTIISPYIMSYSLINHSWNFGYRTVSFIQVGIALLLLATAFVWNINKNKHGKAVSSKKLGLTGALKIKGVPFLLFGFFAYCATEATAMLWASSYLVNIRGVAPELAASFASLFFIGLTFGRFVGGFMMNKVTPRSMIRLGACIIFLGIILVFIPVNLTLLSLIGFVVIGLGCAPIYPCIINSTPTNFGAENSGAIIGIQMASAYVGTTVAPPLFAVLGRWISLHILPIYLAVFAIIMIFAIEKTFTITQKHV
jgi:fucose permease